MARVGETAPPDPGESSTAAPTPADATVQPQTTEITPAETVASPDIKGPIPFERHQAALTNARTKAETEATQRFQEQYGAHVALGQRIQADPVGTVIQMIAEVSQHPEHGQAMVSALARALSQRRGQQQPVTEAQPEPEPQADLQTPDGLRVFSAEQQAKREAWLRNQWLNEVDQRLQPLQAREKHAQATEREAAAKRDSHERMSKVLKPYLEQPEFVENKQAIAERQQALVKEGYDVGTALGLAYTQVLREVVLPAQTAKSQKDLVAQAVAKSTGSTTVPGQSPAAPAKRPQNFSEGFAGIAF